MISKQMWTTTRPGRMSKRSWIEGDFAGPLAGDSGAKKLLNLIA